MSLEVQAALAQLPPFAESGALATESLVEGSLWIDTFFKLWKNKLLFG